jgi:ABC-type cobalt transport system substrate-binding protein
MIVAILISLVAGFGTGYFVGSNNPTSKVIEKIKSKL